MTAPKVPEDEFISMIETYGIRETSRLLDSHPGTVAARRRRIEIRRNIQILVPGYAKDQERISRALVSAPGRLHAELRDGLAFVGGDAHYWPGIVPPAHRAMVRLAERLRPEIVVMNGDIIDGASVKRHPAMNWETEPSLAEEIDAAKDRLEEIRRAAGGKARLYWTLGNHDARFESFLANHAPEYRDVYGVHLHDHFPHWAPCYALWVNNEVVIKHRYRGGTHATYQNVLHSGKSFVTNHLHAQRVSPHTDYNGTRYGVDTGCIADPYGPQFLYLEDNPRPWRSGFAILPFHDGRLLYPQLVEVIDENHVQYLGEVIEV